jgi:hypothetical protein
MAFLQNPHNTALTHKEVSPASAKRRFHVYVGRTDRRDVRVDPPGTIKGLDILLPPASVVFRVRNLSAVHHAESGIVITGKCGPRMSRNRNAVLGMDCGNRINGGLIGVHGVCNPNGNQVVMRVCDLLSADHDGAVRGAGQPLRDLTGNSLVVIRDCDDVETCTLCLLAQRKRRETAVTRKCVHMEITTQNPELAGTNRHRRWTFVCQRSDRQA